MTRMIRKIRKAFTRTPEVGFMWSVEDFNRAKNWAKSEDDPENTNRSLWDRVYSPRKDSVDILHELNSFLDK